MISKMITLDAPSRAKLGFRKKLLKFGVIGLLLVLLTLSRHVSGQELIPTSFIF